MNTVEMSSVIFNSTSTNIENAYYKHHIVLGDTSVIVETKKKKEGAFEADTLECLHEGAVPTTMTAWRKNAGASGRSTSI